MGFRPPYIVSRSYKWTYLYAAVEPTTGESFCLYLPGMDSGCLQSFLKEISQAYSENHLLFVLDGAPSHRSEEIVCPDNVELLRLPAYSPELDPVERWFQEFRRELSNRAFETVELVQEALGQALLPYSGRIVLASDGSLVSPGGWRLSMRYDINNPDRYQDPQGGDGLTRREHRSEGRTDLPSKGAYKRTSENNPSTHSGE